VSCLGLHNSVYELITENGAKMMIFRVLSFFATLWGHWLFLKRGNEIFSNASFELLWVIKVTNMITSSIFSLSNILRFHRAKNDPSWTLSFINQIMIIMILSWAPSWSKKSFKSMNLVVNKMERNKQVFT